MIQTADTLKLVKVLNFCQKGDQRGQLVVLEGARDIPFDIKCVFYIYGSDPEVKRGQFANRKAEFVLINVIGVCKVKIKDGRGNEAVFCLDKPHIGLYLPGMVWKEIYDFSEDSVLLVIASEHYDSEEYVRNYQEFVEEIKRLGL